MSLSPFFHHLRSAYQAELDDSWPRFREGTNVLAKKLAERRKELSFLMSMLELSPEMVAVVFHQGFRFKRTAVMEDLVRQESEDLPEWDTLADSVDLMPWAQNLGATSLTTACRPLVHERGQQPWSICWTKPDARFAQADDADDRRRERP